MIECRELEIRELLPDVLHGSLDPRDKHRVDAHLAGCDHCRAELTVLRAVHAAAVFAPRIDTGRVVREITPYGIAVPVTEPTVRKQRLNWLTAAVLALVVAGAGATLLMRPTARRDTAVPVATAEPGFALTADVAYLSDSELAQLISEMSEFDGLPGGDPEPLLVVDTPDPAEQDSL